MVSNGSHAINRLKAAALRGSFLLRDAMDRSPLGGTETFRALRRLAKGAFSGALGDDGGVIEVSVDGHSLCVPWDFLAGTVAGYEPVETALFKQALRPGARVADVGAYIGHYALVAARGVGPGGSVTAFEPSPDAFELLERNILNNGYALVSARRLAVGRRAGPRRFCLLDHPTRNSFHPHPSTRQVGSRVVECVTLDECLEGAALDLVKMDIEGGEWDALQGMRETLLRSRPLTLFMEFHPSCLTACGADPGDVLRFLTELGFSLEAIDEREGRVSRLDPAEALLRQSEPDWFINLRCVRS